LHSPLSTVDLLSCVDLYGTGDLCQYN
jgi:hypothetical protein